MSSLHVRILNPGKKTTQSGRGKESWWVIEPVLPTARTPNPVTGWIGAQDSLSTLRGALRFARAEDAIAFASRQGWSFDLSPAEKRRVVPKSFLDNFNPRAAS